jgi:hypothetical protein
LKAKYEKSVQSWWKERVVLNAVFFNKGCTSNNSVFPLVFPSMLHLFFIFFGTGFEVLKVVRIHARSVLGRRIVWDMVMNVLEEHSGCIFTALQKMDGVCPDRNHGTHKSDYVSHNLENYNFERSVM